MFSDLSKEAIKCYQHAVEAAERAGAWANAEMREFYLEREQAWLKLAHSYQQAERLSRVLNRRLDLQRTKNFRDWPATARVRNCPSCNVASTVTCNGLVVCPNCQRVVDQVV
jgi:hypothetical protein